MAFKSICAVVIYLEVNVYVTRHMGVTGYNLSRLKNLIKC